MNHKINRVVIVGGGTAGWLSAGIIAAEHCIGTKTSSPENPFQLTLVESPDIATIGVGEGTWPSMRSTLQKMGISETDFFRECSASFKQGTLFKAGVRAQTISILILLPHLKVTPRSIWHPTGRLHASRSTLLRQCHHRAPCLQIS